MNKNNSLTLLISLENAGNTRLVSGIKLQNLDTGKDIIFSCQYLKNVEFVMVQNMALYFITVHLQYAF